MFKRFALLALTLFVSTVVIASSASAEETTQPEHRPMGPLYITKGHLEVAGQGFYQTPADGNGWVLDLSPKVEYFVLNRFSVGGTFRYVDGGTINSQFEVGPSVTYYLTHTSKWAISIDQSIRYVKPEFGDKYMAGETGLAWDYFFTESIALGPAVKALYFFSGDTSAPGDATRFLINFSLFL